MIRKRQPAPTADPGIYNLDQELFERLNNKMYEDHPGGVTLPPEYACFVEGNLTQFMIRLARYKFVARMLRNNDRVLEVGCGSGLGTMLLGQHCAHATGIDVKKTEIAEAESFNLRKNVVFKTLDLFSAGRLPQFDAVVGVDVLEHLTEKNGRRLVARMAELTKPAGMLVLGTPSFYSWEHQSAISKASHVKCYKKEELLSLIDDYFERAVFFSMNDELVHTGHPKMAWYYFVLAFIPK